MGMKGPRKKGGNARNRIGPAAVLSEEERRIVIEQRQVIERAEKQLSMLRACNRATWEKLLRKYELSAGTEVTLNETTGELFAGGG
jgi:hypothetical protein